MRSLDHSTWPSRRCFVCAAAVIALFSASSALYAAQQASVVHKPSSAAGARLYKANCAVCHGNDGKGNGPPPASSPFTESPPDLTTIATRHDGKFPDAYIESVLRNGTPAPEHGPAEMPVWGTLFKAAAKSDEAQVRSRIQDLIAYLKSIQTK